MVANWCGERKVMPRYYDLKYGSEKLKRNMLNATIKTKVPEEWQLKADESYKRISAKYAPKYSVQRSN
jgi:hypothetical protein